MLTTEEDLNAETLFGRLDSIKRFYIYVKAQFENCSVYADSIYGCMHEVYNLQDGLNYFSTYISTFERYLLTQLQPYFHNLNDSSEIERFLNEGLEILLHLSRIRTQLCVYSEEAKDFGRIYLGKLTRSISDLVEKKPNKPKTKNYPPGLEGSKLMNVYLRKSKNEIILDPSDEISEWLYETASKTRELIKELKNPPEKIIDLPFPDKNAPYIDPVLFKRSTPLPQRTSLNNTCGTWSDDQQSKILNIMESEVSSTYIDNQRKRKDLLLETPEKNSTKEIDSITSEQSQPQPPIGTPKGSLKGSLKENKKDNTDLNRDDIIYNKDDKVQNKDNEASGEENKVCSQDDADAYSKNNAMKEDIEDSLKPIIKTWSHIVKLASNKPLVDHTLKKDDASKNMPGSSKSVARISKSLRDEQVSTKIFLGGISSLCTSSVIIKSLENFGDVTIQWPGVDVFTTNNGESSSSGFIFIIFETEAQVKDFLDNCEFEYDYDNNAPSWHWTIAHSFSAERCQVKPWKLEDNYHCIKKVNEQIKNTSLFVGGLHGCVTAPILANFLNEHYGGVANARLDIDKYNYPTGAAKVQFYSAKSYGEAVDAGHIMITAFNYVKRLQLDPFFSKSICSMCRKQTGSSYCRTCLDYYCEICWGKYHIGPRRKHVCHQRKLH